MFLDFLDALRAAGIPASLKEHLVLLEALEREAIGRTPEDFYYLARATYVKDEGLLDRFDQVFAKVFQGVAGDAVETAEIPADWLRAVAEKAEQVLHVARRRRSGRRCGGGFLRKEIEALRRGRHGAEEEQRHQCRDRGGKGPEAHSAGSG